MEVSGHLHGPAALFPAKEPLISSLADGDKTEF
jgi:hypothetical protein